MDRQKAIFEQSSRVYRQATQASPELCRLISEGDSPYLQVLSRLGYSNGIRLNFEGELQSFIEAVNSELSAVVDALSAYHVLPMLLEMTHDIYYKGAIGRDTSYGAAVKRLVPELWVRASSGSGGVLTARQKVLDAVRMSALLLSLETAQEFNFSFGWEPFEVSPTRVGYGDLYRTLADGFTFARMQGVFHRTATDSISAIFKDRPSSLGKLIAILEGEVDAADFPGTLFADIPVVGHDDFWSGIAARLVLFEVVLNTRGAVGLPRGGIAIFEPAGIGLPITSFAGAKIARAFQDLFWTKKWYKSRKDFHVSGMVVERPIVRISKTPELYAATESMVGDSTTLFVESSVMNYPFLGGAKVPDVIRKKFVSTAFEKLSIEEFRKFGWRAGSVSENGIWFDGKNHIDLRLGTKGIAPGEIDVLATSPDCSHAVICECKVLDAPYNAKKILSLRGKIGVGNSAEYVSKLNRKAEWLQHSTPLIEMGVGELTQVILVDRYFPTMFRPEKDMNHIVVTAGEIESLTERFGGNAQGG